MARRREHRFPEAGSGDSRRDSGHLMVRLWSWSVRGNLPDQWYRHLSSSRSVTRMPGSVGVVECGRSRSTDSGTVGRWNGRRVGQWDRGTVGPWEGRGQKAESGGQTPSGAARPYVTAERSSSKAKRSFAPKLRFVQREPCSHGGQRRKTGPWDHGTVGRLDSLCSGHRLGIEYGPRQEY